MMGTKNPTGGPGVGSAGGGAVGVNVQGRISDIVPFRDVVRLLEGISTANSNERKKEKLKRFVDFYRNSFKSVYGTLDSSKAGGDSLYPLIRILVPEVDRGRRSYGIKSSVLGRMFVKILGLDKGRADAKRLLEFKDPGRAGSLAGDIGGIVFDILNDRFSSNMNSSSFSLTDLHEALDELSKASDQNGNQKQKSQEVVLQRVVRKLSALEGKWLVRIILKEMRLGFSSTKGTVYGLLHKQAKVLLERVGDLELLCQKLNDPDAEVTTIDISLFSHFCPMLATRMNSIDSNFEIGDDDDDGPSTSTVAPKKSKADVTLPSPPFYVETKWDGERFQIHYDGKTFKYFSRRAYDFSAKFNETLTPRLKSQIAGHVQSFILDGEMMAYNKKYKIFTQKGYNIDVKTINKDNPNHCPVFVAFDLVYLNGVVLTNTPLVDRRTKLTTVFTPREDAIRLSELRTMNSKQEVVDTLNAAIDDGEEGLIVKDMSTVYTPGKRGLQWLKIKPEFLQDNCIDDLDLVILGAYYTESIRKGGEVSHFLIGLIDTTKGKDEYYPLAKVGSGRLRSLEVKGLVEELSPLFTKTPFANVHFRQRKNPDFMINPAKSIVVQVKASEIIPSDVYSVSHTLRFPRITKIRKDKSPRDVMTVQEFLQLKDSCGGKLVKRTDGGGGRNYNYMRKRKVEVESDEEDEDRSPGKKKSFFTFSRQSRMSDDEEEEDAPLQGPSVSGALLALKPKSQSSQKKSPLKPLGSRKNLGAAASPLKSLVQNNVFQSKLFCVYGTSKWKLDIEQKIQRNGGTIFQNPVKDLFAIVGEREHSVWVEKIIRGGKYDVLKSIWIANSIERGEECGLVPSDYIFMTESTKEKFAKDYDQYGDSWTKPNTVEETKGLLQRITTERARSKSILPSNATEDSDTDEGNATDGSATVSESELFSELFETDSERASVTWNFMRDVTVAFRGPVDFLLSQKLQFYGGSVVDTESDEGVTHVVVSPEGHQSKKDHSRAIVVTEKWLRDCLQERKVIDERRYSAV